MKILFAIFLVTGILISGCITNPLKQVSVVKVNVTFVEKEGIVEAENITFTQGNVDYAGRPQMTKAKEFPAIAGRVMIAKGNESIIMPWENVPYKGNGTYNFNLGFLEEAQPKFNDTIHISIVVLDSKGNKIGYVIDYTIWELN
jgi:hypothetical protein